MTGRDRQSVRERRDRERGQRDVTLRGKNRGGETEREIAQRRVRVYTQA